MDMDRLTLLEQKLEVIMREVNDTLNEVGTAMTGMARVNKMAFESMQIQINQLRAQILGVPVSSVESGSTILQKTETGIEI